MIELENSPNLKDRIKYHAWLKEALARSVKMLEGCEDEDLKTMEARYIKVLKDKITNYDIYQQKVVSKCRTCGEVECVCYVVDKSFEREINKLF